MSPEVFATCIIPIVSAAISLLSVWIGARLSSKSQMIETHRKMLLDSYADVLTKAIQYFGDACDTNMVNLVSSCEKARLLCCEKTDESLTALEQSATQPNRDSIEYGNAVNAFRRCAREEIGSQKKKANKKARNATDKK